VAKYDIAFQPYHTMQNGTVLHSSQLNPAGYISPAHEAMANKQPWYQANYPVALKSSYVRPTRSAILSLPVNPLQTKVNGAY
jgi:hypothetical protein